MYRDKLNWIFGEEKCQNYHVQAKKIKTGTKSMLDILRFTSGGIFSGLNRVAT